MGHLSTPFPLLATSATLSFLFRALGAISEGVWSSLAIPKVEASNRLLTVSKRHFVCCVLRKGTCPIEMNWFALDGEGSMDTAARMENSFVRTDASLQFAVSGVLRSLVWNRVDTVDSR